MIQWLPQRCLDSYRQKYKPEPCPGFETSTIVSARTLLARAGATAGKSRRCSSGRDGGGIPQYSYYENYLVYFLSQHNEVFKMVKQK